MHSSLQAYLFDLEFLPKSMLEIFLISLPSFFFFSPSPLSGLQRLESKQNYKRNEFIPLIYLIQLRRTIFEQIMQQSVTVFTGRYLVGKYLEVRKSALFLLYMCVCMYVYLNSDSGSLNCTVLRRN